MSRALSASNMVFKLFYKPIELGLPHLLDDFLSIPLHVGEILLSRHRRNWLFWLAHNSALAMKSDKDGLYRQ